MVDMPETPATLEGPALLSVREVAERLSISTWTVYELMDAGRIAGVYQGRKRYATPAAIDAYVSSLSSTPDA